MLAPSGGCGALRRRAASNQAVKEDLWGMVDGRKTVGPSGTGRFAERVNYLLRDQNS